MSQVCISVLGEEDVKNFTLALKKIEKYEEAELKEFYTSVGFYDRSGKIAKRYQDIFPEIE